MSDLFLQILSREGSTGREGQRKMTWVEHPKTTTGWPDGDVPLWRSGEENKVFFHCERDMPDGIAIICYGDMAEVWNGKKRLIGTNSKITTDNGVVILPAQVVNPGGRVEIYFNQAGQKVMLEIKTGGKTVKEVNIVCQANE